MSTARQISLLPLNKAIIAHSEVLCGPLRSFAVLCGPLRSFALPCSRLTENKRFVEINFEFPASSFPISISLQIFINRVLGSGELEASYTLFFIRNSGFGFGQKVS